jgi:general stress protein 26
MTQDQLKTKIKEHLESFNLCVISSIGANGFPESATVGFSEDETFNIVLGTSKLSRKAQNIQDNQKVSVVIGTDFSKRQTVQLEGNASILSGDELISYQEVHFAKNPYAKNFKDDPNQIYILVQPTWIRYTDITQSPWLVEELQL